MVRFLSTALVTVTVTVALFIALAFLSAPSFLICGGGEEDIQEESHSKESNKPYHRESKEGER